MDQYARLFGTARIPTQVRISVDRSRMEADHAGIEGMQDGRQRGCSSHRCPQARTVFLNDPVYSDWFDVFDDENQPLLTERKVLQNLQAIVQDADKTPFMEVARTAIGVLTTENRKTLSRLRQALAEDRTNIACLSLIDDAFFVVWLDDAAPLAKVSRTSTTARET
ncbi:hypothetical protein J3R83DRAFT_5511 [Lanmaoa asiatica]|nr:hypothetical protein J3R83DRAFT_5511 [Lanmaoa asiatica]